jgi:hypothetical protein
MPPPKTPATSGRAAVAGGSLYGKLHVFYQQDSAVLPA